MKTQLPILFILLLSLSAVSNAQSSRAAQDLTRLLNEFLAGATMNNAAVHDRFWADDLIYTRSAGVRIGKAEVIAGVRNAPAAKPDDPKNVYTAEDIQIHQYGDTAVIAFRLVSTVTKGAVSEVSNYLNTGTFVKRSGQWKAVAWQSTIVPRIGKP